MNDDLEQTPGQTPKEIAAEIIAQVKGKRGADERSHTNGNGEGVLVLPAPSLPMPVARQLVDMHFTHDGCLTLRYWRGSWWFWRTSHWTGLEDRGIRFMLWRFVEYAVYLHQGNFLPWAPNRNKIANLTDALAAVCTLRQEIDQPCWLEDEQHNGMIVSVGNGLLDIAQQRLLPHTPRYFNTTSVPFNYDPNAAPPERWLAFLNQLWPNDPDAVKVLSEWYGYVISGKLDLHKILMTVGPTRGGKGIIARVLTALIGDKNVGAFPVKTV
jgi:putative DNA primase/helicase